MGFDDKMTYPKHEYDKSGEVGFGEIDVVVGKEKQT